MKLLIEKHFLFKNFLSHSLRVHLNGSNFLIIFSSNHVKNHSTLKDSCIHWGLWTCTLFLFPFVPGKRSCCPQFWVFAACQCLPGQTPSSHLPAQPGQPEVLLPECLPVHFGWRCSGVFALALGREGDTCN